MTGKILKSGKEIIRSRLTATLLSIPFIGFGQIYNGKLLSGLALLFMRALSMMVIPMYIQMKPDGDSTLLFFSSLAFNALLFLYSPAEALTRSSKNRRMVLKRYNSVPVYIAFCLTGTALTALSIFIVMNFFEIRKIEGPQSILFRAGDHVLVLKYKTGGYRRGELVEYRDAGTVKMGRIIGAGGDTVRQDKYTFSVNDIQLGIGAFDEQEMRRLDLGDYGKILSESSGGLKYPIKTDIEKDLHGKAKFQKRLAGDEVLVAGDDRDVNNFYSIIKTGSISGRVEGVIMADDIRRMMIRPY